MPSTEKGFFSKLFEPVTNILKGPLSRDSYSDRAFESPRKQISNFFSDIFRAIGNIIAPPASHKTTSDRMRAANFCRDSIGSAPQATEHQKARAPSSQTANPLQKGAFVFKSRDTPAPKGQRL